jgi:hypothetical protein
MLGLMIYGVSKTVTNAVNTTIKRPNERNLRNVIWDKQELSRQRRVVLLTIPQIGTDHAFPGTFSTALQCLPGLALATLARI